MNFYILALHKSNVFIAKGSMLKLKVQYGHPSRPVTLKMFFKSKNNFCFCCNRYQFFTVINMICTKSKKERR